MPTIPTSNKNFLGLWILANIAGWAVCLVVNYVFAANLARFLASGDSQTFHLRFMLGAISLGVMMGFGLGIVQWGALVRWRAFSPVWIVANVVGASIGLVLVFQWFGAPVSSLFLPPSSELNSYFTSLLLFSLCVSISQGVMLGQKRIALGLLWLPVASIIGLIGFIFGIAFAYPASYAIFGSVLAFGKGGWVSSFLLGSIAGGITGFVIGIPTGCLLLLIRPKKPIVEST